MDEKQFREILEHAEGEQLDFKAAPYDLGDEKGRSAFVKDVLAMANTPRDGTSLIILGVKKHSDNSFELPGVAQHPDEANLQSQFSDRVHPIPAFSYEVVDYEGKKFAVIAVPPTTSEGPFVPYVNYGLLSRHAIYFRRGSKNETAELPEDLARIIEFFQRRVAPNLAYASGDPPWETLLGEVDNFESARHFVLITSPVRADPAVPLESLGLVPWVAAIDFDPDGEVCGALSAIKGTLSSRRSIHLVTAAERPELNLRAGCYWFFARGLQGRLDSLALGPWREWKGRAGAKLADHMKRLAGACSPVPVTFLVVWTENSLIEHLQSTLESILDAFGESAKVVLATGDKSPLVPVAEKFALPIIEIPLHHLCGGLSSIFAPVVDAAKGDCRFPTSSGSELLITEQQRVWLQEELDLVDLSAGQKAPEGRPIGRDFLRGAEISWYELALDYDIRRDVLEPSRLPKQVQADIDRRRASRINVYHAPGAGGTTVGRRVLWDFHRRNPTAILRKTNPKDTAERIALLTGLTGLPLLLMVDGAEVSDAQVDELSDLLRSRNLPVVILQILRRFQRQGERSRAFYLDSELSNEEANKIARAYALEQPDRRRAIDELLKAPQRRLRSTFYFGLVAFQKDFLGLEPFVRDRLNNLTPDQVRVICILALAHHYAQRPVSAQVFSSMLGVPEQRSTDLRAVLPTGAQELLVESDRRTWRTSHELIANEIIEQVLSGSSERRLWRQNLSTWAIDFATVCRGSGPVPSEELLETTRRAFIYRDNSEILGTERAGAKQFSQLIQDVPANEGKLRVLKHLVELYPDEPHFWAHLGRFYNVEMRDYDSTADCIEKAIALDPRDSVLHHMKGMALRHQVYSVIDKAGPMPEALAIAKRAGESFAHARELNPDDDHGYISEAQMLARLIDYGGSQHPDGPISYLSGREVDPFLRDSFERAEDLLERVRRNREGQSANSYEEGCRARLDVLYGHYDRALRVLSNLLTRTDVYKPPVRRNMVWTILAKQGRSWEAVSQREGDTIVALLEENLREEPNSDSNLRLWMQAVRRAGNTPSLEAVLEKLAYWRAASRSIDASFYLYVVYALQAIEGSVLARESALRWLDDCRSRSRYLRNRTKSYEWLGIGTGLGRLVHHSQLGEWSTEKDFWENTDPLARVVGRIASIEGPQAGQIETEGGFEAFFVPARGKYVRGDENRAVTFLLGFSYDGLRAWEVHNV